jgi:ATP:corrinoid adenosyltransferase
MPIKLLSKQEINQRKAIERKVEIDEGAKLARRIDSLREIVANEEASLASFRSKTIASINADIQKVTTERDNLLQEVTILRSELERGDLDLKIREQRLAEAQTELVEKEKTLQLQTEALKKLTKSVREEEKKTKTYNQRFQYVFNVLAEMNKSIETNYLQSEEIVKQIQSKLDKVNTLIEETTKELRDKDIDIASRERDITIKEERIKRTTKELREKEIQLRDREFTLEREFKRLKKL